MQVGLALPHYDTSFEGKPASWESVARTAQTAEASGFDSIWVSDHLFLDWGKYGGPGDPQGALECLMTVSALSQVTQRVRIGTLAICNDFRNPGLLAKMLASIDHLSGGRLEVGLGAGWYEPEYEAAGFAFSRPGLRIARLGESVDLIRRLLEGEEVTHKGRFYEMDRGICRPVSLQRPHPPIWIGGKGDYLLKTVARRADGWNFSWLGDIATYKERLEVARRACEAEGRDPATLRLSVGVYGLVGIDDADVRKRFDRLAERTPPGVLSGLDGASAVSFEEFKRSRFAGTVGEVTDRLGELKDIGVEEVIFTLGTLPFQLGALEDVEIVGAEVAPHLK